MNSFVCRITASEMNVRFGMKMNLKFEYTYSDFNPLFVFDEDPTELFSIQYMMRDLIINEIEFEYSKFG